MHELPENPHLHLLAQRLPAAAAAASATHWQRLRSSLMPAQGLPGAEAAWFANARPELREGVLACQADVQRSQQALARALRGFKQVDAFCQPLLQDALGATGFTLDVRETELLHVTRTWSWSATTFLYSSERQSLLQAALANFADDVTFTAPSAVARPDDIVVRNVSVTGRAPVGYQVPAATFSLPSQVYEVTPSVLHPERFAQACRELDLGQRYQQHLQQVYEGNAARHISQCYQQAARDQLALALSLDRLRHGLEASLANRVEALLDGGDAQCWQLSLFGLDLHDVTLIDAGADGLVLYLPAHQPALQACPDLAAVHACLTQVQLAAEARQAFLEYLPLDQRARYLDLLHQNLDARGDSPDDQPWQAAAQPDLHLARTRVTTPLFEHLYARHLARLKQQALHLAVPTARADEQARQRRLAEWERLGLNALMLTSLFVPAMGPLMLAVTACQLLDEAYEGCSAWSLGDRHAALGHFEAVGLNLALIGGVHVAGKALHSLLSSPLLENLEQVTCADGSRRLWRPDLATYRSPEALPDGLQPNRAGQYVHDGRYFVRMAGERYEQRFDTTLERWRIVHPDDPDAYQPLLEHNGEGAWRAEHEAPQQWSLATLVRRLSPDFTHFDDAQLQSAARRCGLNEDALRQVHLQGLPTPLLLSDSLARVDAERLAAAQLNSLPEADPATLFAQHYDPDAVPDPVVERLCQAHPNLPRPLARRLAARLSDFHAEPWPPAKPLPYWLDTAARQAANGLPLVRAIEGLTLPRLVNADSERVLWACLGRLPGWPAGVRFELRAASPQGPLLQTLGSAEAGKRYVVFKSANGYEADLGERPAPATQDHDLCRAVFDALPAAYRAQLGVAAKGADGLRQRVLQQLEAERPRFSRLLQQPQPARWGGPGLRGGDLTGVYPRLSLGNSLRGRYQRLFPSASDHEFNTTLARWRRQSRSAELELTDLEARLRQLRLDLATWARQAPHRQRAVSYIVSAWRRDAYHRMSEQISVPLLNLGGLELDNSDIASLALPDDFQHVEELELSGNRQLSSLHPEFIERFPRLRRLMLRDCRFATVPPLPAPLRLTALDLQGNRITWDRGAQASLERAANLRYLDLSDNPLLTPPRLATLNGLQFVEMHNASLTALPEGLQSLGELEVLDLSDNPLDALPDDLELPPHVAGAMQLESDLLSPRARQQIDAYHARHGIDLLVSDHDYSDLLDQAGPERLAIWGRLPVAYRRGLRAVLLDDRYLANPEVMLEEFWRRLGRIDREPHLRDYALSEPAWRLLQLPL